MPCEVMRTPSNACQYCVSKKCKYIKPYSEIFISTLIHFVSLIYTFFAAVTDRKYHTDIVY